MGFPSVFTLPRVFDPGRVGCAPEWKEIPRRRPRHGEQYRKATLISVVHRGGGDGEFDPLPGGLTTVSTLGFFNVLIWEIMEPVIQLPYTALMSNMVSDQM